MRLFASSTSPFVRKVSVLIREAGLTDQVEVVPVTGGVTHPGTMPLQHNPLGKIPALERPDGPALYDSRVICRYLDDLAGAGLYPAAADLWDVLTLEATADGILESAVLIMYESHLRPEGVRYAPWVEGQWAKIDRALDALESRWMDALEGSLTMAQIAVGVAMGYLDFRLADRNWRQGRPRLAVWDAHFATRPSMQATRPVALA